MNLNFLISQYYPLSFLFSHGQTLHGSCLTGRHTVPHVAQPGPRDIKSQISMGCVWDVYGMRMEFYEFTWGHHTNIHILSVYLILPHLDNIIVSCHMLSPILNYHTYHCIILYLFLSYSGHCAARGFGIEIVFFEDCGNFVVGM